MHLRMVMAVAVLISLPVAAQTITLTPESGGNFRYKDVLGQAYSSAFINGYSYANSSVTVTLNDNTGLQYVTGRIVATGLKPNFAFQIKLEGRSDDIVTNERLGYMGRWWFNGNATDAQYNNRAPGDSYAGYLVVAFFVTDSQGRADVVFEGNNSFHVLWRTNQRTPAAKDGPVQNVSLATTKKTDPFYGRVLAARTAGIFGEYENTDGLNTRALPGALQMPEGQYNCNLVLTEESFHDSGANAGGWAAAFRTPVSFAISTVVQPPPPPPPPPPAGANDDFVSTSEGVSLSIPVLANDEGEGLSVSLSVATSQSGAGLTVSNNLVIYVPAVGFSGTDTFQYTITDASGATDSATVTVTVVRRKGKGSSSREAVSEKF